MLFNSEADLVARFPHIESLAGLAPNCIYSVFCVRCQDLPYIAPLPREGIENVGEANETNLRDSRRLPSFYAFVEFGVDQHVLEVFIPPVGGDQPARPQRVTVPPGPLKIGLEFA